MLIKHYFDMTFSNSLLSAMAIYVMSLLVVYIILAIYIFVRSLWIREERPQGSLIQEFHGMSHCSVKSLTSESFAAVKEDNASERCAICLEDYNLGEKLRILPCCHRFHAICVDEWLTSWRTCCPLCKRDARTSTSTTITIEASPPASQFTPLLSSSLPSTYASSVLSSITLPYSPSSAAQLLPSYSGAPVHVGHSMRDCAVRHLMY